MVNIEVATLMAKLEQRINLARTNPEAVLHGEFRGFSPGGEVSVWVDARGRVKRCEVTQGAAYPGAEQRLADAFLAAHQDAQRAAENLEFPEFPSDPWPPAAPQPQPDASAPGLLRPATDSPSRPQPVAEPPRRPALRTGDDDDFENTSYLQ